MQSNTPLGTVTNILEEFNTLPEMWSPKVISETSDCKLVIVRAKDDFIWHTHEDEDKTFLVIEGELTIDFRDSSVRLKQGEFFVIPKGVESKPSAAEETKLLIIAPK